jgi:uncharacterized membrane protein
VGIGIRIHGLIDQPVWYDEAFTYRFSSKPLVELWGVVPTYEPHPPLYYTLTRLAMVPGSSEAWLRLPALLFGILTIPVVYATARLAFGPHGRSASLLAALLFALNALQVQYAQEARSYSMLVFAVALVMYAGVSLVQRMQAPPGARAPEVSAARWVGFGLCMGFVVWAHYTAAIVAATAGVAVAIVSATERRLRTDFRGICVAAVSAAIVAAAPLYWAAIQFGNGATSWIQPPNLEMTAGIVNRVAGIGPFASYVGSHGVPMSRIVLAGTTVLLAAFGFWSLWRARQRAAAILLGCMAVIPLATIIAVSVTLRPVLLARTVLWETLPLVLLGAIALRAIRPKILRRLFVVAVLGALVLSVALHKRDFRKEPWDEVVATIRALARPGDLVIIQPNSAELPFRYYWDRIPPRYQFELPILALPAPFPTYVEPIAEIRQDLTRLKLSDEDIDRAVNAAVKAQRIWLVRRTQPADEHDHRLLTALATDRHATVLVDSRRTQLVLLKPQS